MAEKYIVAFGRVWQRVGDVLNDEQIHSIDMMARAGIYHRNNEFHTNAIFILRGDTVDGRISYTVYEDALHIHFMQSNPSTRKDFYEKLGHSIAMELISQALKKHEVNEIRWEVLSPEAERFFSRAEREGIFKTIEEHGEIKCDRVRVVKKIKPVIKTYARRRRPFRIAPTGHKIKFPTKKRPR